MQVFQKSQYRLFLLVVTAFSRRDTEHAPEMLGRLGRKRWEKLVSLQQAQPGSESELFEGIRGRLKTNPFYITPIITLIV